MTLPQVPSPAGIPKLTDLYATMATLPNGISAVDHIRAGRDKYEPIPATSIDPIRLKSFEKAVKLAKPMGGK